jgi:thiamine biosynthesis protein ThiS
LRIDVRLHGILRDQLPPQAKGRARIELENGATLGALLEKLGIDRRVVIAVNDEEQKDRTHVLRDGDQVAVFTVIGGGQPGN